jgi:hypothetical protein
MQRRIHENSLANLNRFQPGRSGNPGGRPKGIPSIEHAIYRLLALPPDDLKAFEPQNQAEVIALQRIKDAGAALNSVAIKATEMILNRTDGPVDKRIVIDTSQAASVRREVRYRYQSALELNQAVASASHCEHCERIVSLSSERIQEIIISQFPPQLHGIVIAEMKAIEEGG